MLFFLLVFVLLFSLFLFSFSSFFLFCSDPSAFFVILILNRHRQGRRKADRQEVQVLLHNQLCNVIAHSLRQFLINLPSEREEGKMSVERALSSAARSRTQSARTIACLGLLVKIAIYNLSAEYNFRFRFNILWQSLCK